MARTRRQFRRVPSMYLSSRIAHCSHLFSVSLASSQSTSPLSTLEGSSTHRTFRRFTGALECFCSPSSPIKMSSNDGSTCDASASAAFGQEGHPSWMMAAMFLLAIPTMIWLIGYTIPQLFMAIRPVPDLKKRYQAEWALVTGGGSGIGKALAFKLAKQGLNVVIVSLDDKYLKETMDQLKEVFPKLQFRSVGVSFSPGVDYLKQIDEATKDVVIPIIFSNAGFLVTGFFDQAPLGKLLANVECNATASVNVAHHFIAKLVSSKKKGCVVFTSSVAGWIPTPFSGMYGATKAFVSQLACCLHIELKALGIDVCAVHPSPVSSNFYNDLDHKIEILESACKAAVPPEALPDDIFRSIGACALRDLGGMAVGTRMGTFFLPYNFFTELFATAAPYLPDWKTHSKNRH